MGEESDTTTRKCAQSHWVSFYRLGHLNFGNTSLSELYRVTIKSVTMQGRISPFLVLNLLYHPGIKGMWQVAAGSTELIQQGNIFISEMESLPK